MHPRASGTFGRSLGGFPFDGVKKGLCARLFRDLWDLRGSSALIQFIPLTPKSLETISRYRVSRFCSSASASRCRLPPLAPVFTLLTNTTI